jgi:5-methyltetrahydrofolate--homocysteine methyltransferase
MIIIGERLNSSRRPVLEALRDRDEEYVLKEARRQEKAGASYLDVNTAALLGKEIETLAWVIPLLQRELCLPLSLDTPNLKAMEEGLRLHEGRALLNSLTGEAERMKRVLPLIKEYKPRIIALCLDDEGLPASSAKELAVAQRLVDLLEKEGVNPQDIFVDPLVRPVGVDQNAVNLFLESLEKIKESLPSVRTVAGISNVSFGLPQRRLLNAAMLVLGLEKGLDAAILDPLDREIMAALASSEALLGHDPGLKNYLAFARKSRVQAARRVPLQTDSPSETQG